MTGRGPPPPDNRITDTGREVTAASVDPAAVGVGPNARVAAFFAVAWCRCASSAAARQGARHKGDVFALRASIGCAVTTPCGCRATGCWPRSRVLGTSCDAVADQQTGCSTQLAGYCWTKRRRGPGRGRPAELRSHYESHGRVAIDVSLDRRTLLARTKGALITTRMRRRDAGALS